VFGLPRGGVKLNLMRKQWLLDYRAGHARALGAHAVCDAVVKPA
jgi:hypothetical protein